MKKLDRDTQWLFIIGIGFILRAGLLINSIPSQSYYGGDASGYLSLADSILNGTASPKDFFWPPGYPLLLAFFKLFFNPSWAVCLFQLMIYPVFAKWLFVTVSQSKSKRTALYALLFITFDPVWVAHNITLGTDFLGAVIFGIIYFGNSRPSVKGLLLSLATFFKPVYQWVFLFFIPLFRKNGFTWLLIFSLFCVIPIGSYRYLRWRDSGDSAFSGHGANQFAKYIKGRSLVVTGEAATGDEGEAMATRMYELRLATDPSFSYPKAILETIQENPVTVTKLFLLSTARCLFGHANSEWSRFMTGDTPKPAALWVTLSRGESLPEKLDQLSLWYIFGALVSITIRLLVLVIATKGLFSTPVTLDRVCTVLLIGYFACTPIVFGEPRLFLPGTLLFFTLMKDPAKE